MVNIILDTNFLLIPAQFGVDILAEIGRVCDFPYTLVIIDRTVDELQAIAQGTGKDASAAKVALALIDRYRFPQLPAAEDRVDDAILRTAARGWIVGTQDRELRDKLQAKGVQLLTMRGKSHLTIV